MQLESPCKIEAKPNFPLQVSKVEDLAVDARGRVAGLHDPPANRPYVFGLIRHFRISAYQCISKLKTAFQMFLFQMDVLIRVNTFLRASQ